MVEREASGEFDYLLNDTTDSDESGRDAPHEPVASEDTEHAVRDDDVWDDPDDSFWSDEPEADDDGSFDAFDSRTWSFEPAPTPWYRTKPALSALIAATVAVVALVISAVLLVFRSPGTVDDETTSVTPTAPTTAAPTQSPIDRPPPPPAPPPPPPETSAESINPAPAQTIRPDPPRSRGP